MRALLATELRTLSNLFLRRSGRKELIGFLILISCTLFGGLIIGHTFVDDSRVVEALQKDDTGTLARLLLATALLPTVMLALAVAMQQVRDGLFARPDIELVLTSPSPPYSSLLMVFLRVLIGTTTIGASILIAPTVLVLLRANLSLLGILMIPPAIVLCTGPVIAVIVAMQVLLKRFLATPRIELAFQFVGAVVMIAFALIVMIGFMSGDDEAERLMKLLQKVEKPPALLDWPAQLLLAPSGLGMPVSSLGGLLLLAILPAAVIGVLGPLYPRAYENSVVSGPPIFRSRRGHGRRWPATLFKSILARDLAEVRQVPANLFLFVFLAILVVWIGISSLWSPPSGGAIPSLAHEVFGLVPRWTMALLISASLVTPGMVFGEKAQWPLLASAPIDRRTLLLGRLIGLSSPPAWCLLVTVVTAVALGTSALGAALFLLVAIPSFVLTMATVAFAGTLPFTANTHAKSSGMDLVGVLLPQVFVIGQAIGLLVLAMKAQSWTRRYYESRGPFEGWPEAAIYATLLGSLWVVGLGVAFLEWKLAVRQHEKLLDPR